MTAPVIGSPNPRTISLQPRPRSPAQLIAMLKAVTKYDGIEWGAKDNKGQLISQIIVGDAIKESQSFDISPKSEKEFQSRTYLTMIPPTLGFAYIDDNKKLRITEAGKQAADEKNLDVLFTRQMIKWQYPSNSHGGSGGKGASSFPLRKKWSLHPFVSAIKICLMLEEMMDDEQEGYLSKSEVAMFLLTMEKDNQVSSVCKEIIEFRNSLSKKSGMKRRQLGFQRHFEKMQEVYQKDIDVEKYKIRQRKTNTVEEFLTIKIANTLDYADTLIRYCRFTGLFSSSDRVRRMVLNPHQKWKCKMIASEKSFLKINSDIDDKEKFFAWFGNPAIPTFPWESREGHQQEILENLSRVLVQISN